MDDIKGLLVWAATIAGILLGFAALLLAALGHVSDSSGAKGQAAMTGCAIGAALCFGAAAFLQTQNLTYTP